MFILLNEITSLVKGGGGHASYMDKFQIKEQIREQQSESRYFKSETVLTRRNEG